MINKLILEQLQKVEKADLSNFNPETNTYIISKRKDIKLEEDVCYLIHLKNSFFKNDTVIYNWNAGSLPTCSYLKVDVSKIMGKMIKVVSVGYDMNTKTDLSCFWSGWINTEDIDVLKQI